MSQTELHNRATDPLQQVICHWLAPITGLTVDILAGALEFPPQDDQGDRALPCFPWAKQYKKSPQALAKDWLAALLKGELPPELDKVEVAGGYLNFFANPALLAQNTLTAIEANPESYGFIDGQKKPVSVVEFSSPNIAKPFSIGHLRSTNLGACIARLLEATGWNVVRINHLGDWGTQFGKLICAYRRWGRAEDLDEKPMDTMFKLYVRFHEEEKNDPHLTDEARAWFAKLEKGDTEARELWQWFRDLTMKELHKLYQRLNIHFDHYWGESHYTDLLDDVQADLAAKQLTKVSEEALIVDLEEHHLGVALIKKKDESSLYLTRDIAAALYRQRQLKFDRMLYVVGNPQQLHFKQLFKVLELLGCAWHKQCEHIGFGHLSLGEQRMATRTGNVVFLEDVLKEAEKHAFKMVEEKNPDLDNKKDIAQQIALAAVLFADVRARRGKDVKFSWEDIVSFEGETGPYLQYTLVRTKSLIRRFNHNLDFTSPLSDLLQPTEIGVIRALAMFPLKLQRAAFEREPFVMGQYLCQLAQAFNRFYADVRILDDQEVPTVNSRMRLVQGVAHVLQTGLQLLGIPTPEQM